MKKLIYLGSGEYAFTMYDGMTMAGPFDFELAGFCQNLDPERRGETFEGYPVYWVEDLAELAATHVFICPLANAKAKRRFVEQADGYGVRYARVESARSRVSRFAEIGTGLMLSSDSIICSHARVGAHVSIMMDVLLSEKVEVGDYSFIAGGTKIGGFARLGNSVFVGMNATIRDHVRIGDGATVAMGSVVTKDVPEGLAVAGNPAKPITPAGKIFKVPDQH